MHYALKDLPWTEPDEHGISIAEVTLKSGDSAWNPASTKRNLYGPCEITYERSRVQIVAWQR